MASSSSEAALALVDRSTGAAEPDHVQTAASSKDDTTDGPEGGGEGKKDDSAGEGKKEEDDDDDVWKIDEVRRLATGVLAGTFVEAPAPTAEDEPRPFDVVLVHGIHGSTTKTWEKDGTNWVSATLHEKYPKSRVLDCDYPSDEPRLSAFTLEGLREHATEILSDLLIYREEMGLAQDLIRPIVFIAHDIGGIIVKLALWIALLDYPKYRNVIDSVQVLIFFGCPHRSTTDAALEDMIANLLYSASETRAPRIAENVKTLTKAVSDVNGFFGLSNLAALLEVVNVHSTSSSKTEQVFDSYTATFGVSFEEIIPVDSPHQQLAQSPDAEKFYPIIDRALTAYTSKSDDHTLDVVRTFHNIAPTAALIQPVQSLGKRFDWIIEHETFSEWLNGYGTDLLYVHGKERLSEASVHLIQTLNDMNTAKTKGKDILVTFKFDKYNDQRNSAISLLTALIEQIIRHKHTMTDYPLVEQLQFYKSWSQTELFFLFSTIINHNDHEGMIIAIEGIDQCNDSRLIFLQDLCRRLSHTEHRIKVLVTGLTDPKIENFLTNHRTIVLDQQSADEHKKHDLIAVRNEYLYLLEHNPAFSAAQAELRDYFTTRFADDSQLRRMISNYLLINPQLLTDSKQRSILKGSGPQNSRDMCLRVLSNVPQAKRRWARKAILWILLSFRPLKTWELGTALALEFDNLRGTRKDVDDFGYSYVASEILSVFQGLFYIKDHEIYPAHQGVRDFFSATKADRSWYDVSKLDHMEILEAIWAFFSLPQVQKSISRQYIHEPVKGQAAVFPESFDDHFYVGQANYHKHSFASYAARFWTKHYNLLSSDIRTTIMRPFLDNTSAVRAFDQVHWWLEIPAKKRTRGFVSNIPLLAHLGLDDLIDLKDCTLKDRALALTEAARNGHTDVVRLLIKYDDYDKSELESTFNTSGVSENEALMVELVEWATDLIAKREKADATTKENEQTNGTRVNGTGTNAAEVEDGFKRTFPFPAANTLCRAIVFSFERLARLLLKLGSDIQVTSVQNYTPLDFAVRQRNPNILKLVIDNKAEIGLNRTLSYHPLHLAVIYGMPELVQLLVDAGIKLDLKNTSDSTATYLGSWHRHYRAIEPIVKAGADLHNDAVGIWTPLTCCARRDTRKCAEILLKNGANVDVIGFNEWTPLRSATVQGYVEFSKLLLEHKADPNSKSGAKGAPIMCEVARQGNMPLLKLLIEHGADVRAMDFNKSSSLLNAAVCGKTEVAEYLIDHDADLLDEDITGFNAIALASYSSYPETIKMLSQKGVDMHKETKTTWTPIHYAYDDAETTKVLMDLGADPNKVSEFYTPLILAATFNKPETVKTLLKYNPKLEIPYENPNLNPGLTALAIAATNQHTEIVRDLLDAGANVNHQSVNGSFCLEYPVRDNNLPLLKMLLEYSPNQSLVDAQGNTALHCVVGGTTLEIAKALVNAGAPLTIVNKRGYTPLGEAVCESHLEIIKYLISKGSEINDIGGETGGPFHTAVRNCSFEIVEILVKANADINLLDPCLGTPVQAACSRWIDDDDSEEAQLREKILKYLIEEKDADLNIEGGDYGCALNAVCAFASEDAVKIVLDRQVKVNVADKIGRTALHFAAQRGMQNFLPIHGAGGDIEARDKQGKTVLHWAAIGGNTDVIERVLSLSRHMLDERDIDGWTPLLWACRGAGTAMNKRSVVAQKAVITLLLKRGADPNVVASGGGGNRSWSPLSVAKYNGGENAEGFMEWLIELIKEKAGDKFDEKAEVHKVKKAKIRSPYCDSCLMTICGLRYRCKTCLNHDFCTKCYQSIKKLHFDDHVFNEEGPEWEDDDKKEGEGSKKDDDDSSDDSDEDDKDKAADGNGEGGEDGKKDEKGGGEGDGEGEGQGDKEGAGVVDDTDSDTDDDE